MKDSDMALRYAVGGMVTGVLMFALIAASYRIGYADGARAAAPLAAPPTKAERAR